MKPADKPRAKASTRDANRITDVRTLMSEMLVEQALYLDEMFTELAGQAANNLTTWPGTARDYARLALRAQSNCRASLVAVERIDRSARPASDASAA